MLDSKSISITNLICGVLVVILAFIFSLTHRTVELYFYIPIYVVLAFSGAILIANGISYFIEKYIARKRNNDKTL